jgi:drug/metabolite transporter (DMT)-like permease
VANWILFLVPSAIWGTTWVIIKFQLSHVAPEVSVAYRFGAAALVLFAWCVARGHTLRYKIHTHFVFAAIGIFQYSLDYVFLYHGERYLTSGCVAVVFSSAVVWNIVGSWVFFTTRASPAMLAGAALGVLGVVLVFWPELTRALDATRTIIGVTLVSLAALTSAAANLGAQRLYVTGVGVLQSTAWSMLYGCVAVVLYCVTVGLTFDFDDSPRYVASLVYLAVVGSVVAFVAYLTLLTRIGASRVSYTAVVTPGIAMAVSTVFEGYRWNGLSLAGMGLVVAGNAMVLRGKHPIRFSVLQREKAKP